MATENRSRTLSRSVAWLVAGLFVLGFFYSPVGMWTGPILAVWFVGTQKPLRGFLWMLAIALVPGLVVDWRALPLTGLRPAAIYLGAALAAAVLAVLPYTFHRLVSPRLPGFLCTLPLPMAAVAIHSVPFSFLPAEYTDNYGSLQRLVWRFVIDWFAATVVWLWNREPVAATPAIAWPAKRPQAPIVLQSPATGQPLRRVLENGSEYLLGADGERFPIRNGVPSFLQAGDLTGSNGKYNGLYETIGGFYDDTQRVWCALRGKDQHAHFLSYLRMLEIEPGDSVLETSVGTGLNFKYLPRGVRLTGLDLSPTMLARCQENLRKWGLSADLYLGNAESLPFADASFDVVFHVGGINFFNDRGKAIREMIRVAKPGSLLLIADETEVHAKSVYENFPITGRYFKNRKEPVTAPVHLVPAEMEDVRLHPLLDGHFYALTFRKPVTHSQTAGALESIHDHRDVSRGAAAVQLHDSGR